MSPRHPLSKQLQLVHNKANAWKTTIKLIEILIIILYFFNKSIFFINYIERN